jgi:SAM-dependent methyltransferase
MIIELGCGSKKLHPSYFGIDCQKLDGVNLVHDCNLPIPLKDDCADLIYAIDFLEHLQNDKRIHIMTEIWRLLKPNGRFISSTPSTDGRGAFQDPTHYAFWNQNSFYYYSDDAMRNLYGIKPKFNILKLETTPLNSANICWVNAELVAVKPELTKLRLV